LGLISAITRTISTSLDLDATLKAILVSVQDVVPYDLAEICLWEPDAGVLRTRAQGTDPKYAAYATHSGGVYTLQDGLTGWIARHRRPLLIHDLLEEKHYTPKVDPGEFPIRAHIGVPLMIGNELVGTLELASYTPGAFAPANVATLQTVASQAAVAIQNARLFQETRRRAEEMTALREAAVEVSGNFDQAHILNSIVERATDLLKGQGGVLYKVDTDKQRLNVLVSYRLQPDLIQETLQFGEGVSGQVAQKRRPIIVNDYKHWEGNTQPGADISFNAILGVPVIWQDELMGVSTFFRMRRNASLTTMTSACSPCLPARLPAHCKPLTCTSNSCAAWKRRRPARNGLWILPASLIRTGCWKPLSGAPSLCYMRGAAACIVTSQKRRPRA